MKLKLTTDKILKTGIVLLLSAIIGIIAITINESQKINDTAKWVAHTQEVLFQSEKVLTLLVDKETGARGYIITGNKTFLEPLEKSQKEIYNALARLKALVSENPAQQFRIDSLSLYIDKKISFSNRTVSVRDVNGANAATTLVQTGEGKFYTDRIRIFIDKMQAAENVLLVQRKQANEQVGRSFNNILLALTIAILILVIILLMLFRFQVSAKNKNKADLGRQIRVKTAELNNVFERITDAFVALDTNWCYSYMNKKAGEIFQRNPPDMIGKHIWTEFPEGVDQTFYKAYHRAMKEQQYIHVEEYYPPYDKWFENHIYPSPDGLSVFFRDITEQKQAEEKLKQSEEKFRVLVENNDSIIGMFDEHLNPIYRSPSTYRILGWTMEEKANDTQLNHVHPDDSELFKNTLKEVMANPGKAVKRSVRLKHKNGNWVMLEGTITNLLHNSSVRAIVSNIQDITERKKAEQAVKESEEKFRTLVQQAADGIVIVDHGGNYLEANESMSKLTGYSISELTKMNARQIVEAEDLQKNPLKLEEIKTGNPVFLERVIVKKDGTLRDVEISAKLMHNGKVICIMRDVTNRKQAEAAFKQAHERLVFHLDNSPLGYIEWDKNLFVRTWSKRTEEIFGWLEKEFIEKQLNGFNLVHEDDVAELTAIAKQLMEGTVERNHVIHRNYTKSGKIIWCEWFNSVLKDKEGNVITIMSLVQDITERKKMEEALKENENYLRTILDTEPECVKVLNSKGELLSMNPAGLAMIEADSEQQVVGHRMTEMVDEKYRAGFNRLSKEVFNGHSGTFEFQITGLKGGHRWLETHAVPLKDSAGKITNLLGVTRNITERKKAEEEITNTTEQLRQLTAHLQNIREDERKRIAREIHDDLGQQLTAIKMDTVWIDKQIPAETSAVKDKLQNILELLDGSHQSVRKILNELRPAVLDDNGLLEALQWQGQQFTESTSTPVHFASNQSSLKVPQETATCIFRVYQESLTNIMRYAGAGKVVSSLNIISDSIILAIEDDGKGFDVKAVQNKKSFGLLGMKERVHSLNGKIDLISSPGKGTKIVISLPYKKT